MRTNQRRQLCILLPNKQQLDCTVGVKARGREVLSSVLRQLGVGDLHVLGLAVLRDSEYLFLDLDLKLSKYFGKRWNRRSTTVPFIVFLRVRYYVENGQLISSGRVRQLYYTELRQRVLRSQSRQQEALFFQLAASALQAEVGDLERGAGGEEEEEEEEEGRRYFLPEDYFPTWLIRRRGRGYLLLHCPVLHGELRGVSRGRAMLQFIKEAGRLQDAPLTFYRMRREKRELRSSILLGVAVRGVHIYEEVEGKLCLLHDLSWTDVDRFTYQGSRFVLAAVGSLCLPELVYYTHSAFHCKHVLRHLSDSHRHHVDTRDAADYIQQLEDVQASRFYKEAYICDTARLRERLQSGSLTSSCMPEEEEKEKEEEEEEDEGSVTAAEFESCVDEPEEVFVDNPAEVSWLAELVHGASVDGPLVLPSSWTAVTMEMKRVLRTRADEVVSVD